MRNLIELLFVVIVALPFAVLPRRMSRQFGAGLGLLAFSMWGSRRKIGIDNLQAAIDRGALASDLDAHAIIKENFRRLGMSLSEIVRIYTWGGPNVLGTVRLEGLENFNEAKARGKGIIVATAHYGNWELLPMSMPQFVGRFSAVARKQNNPYLNYLVEHARQKNGCKVVYKQGALKKFLSELKNGEAVGVLIDQSVLPAEGIKTDFLGAPAWSSKIVSALAKRTGAAVVPLFITREGEEHVATFYPEVELTGDDLIDTQKVYAQLERCIADKPEEWLWIHRRWKRT